ncbi:PQQ-binding-like beta-propeller repeat protein [Kitasatospora sp. NPDC051170]|uniref:outer membrane protein assembly factor BamB family protein n=1 Tax=Kitasatospora sp. NPDC051170 TaxID=3364056 RepID=UPI003788D0D4
MAQEPFGDAHAGQQQPWYPQEQPQQDWAAYQQHEQHQQQPGWDAYGQAVPPYGQGGYEEQQGGGYGPTGYAEGGYVQEPYQGYPAYQDHGQQQVYPAYESPEDGIYVPEGAAYSTDGYVQLAEEPAEAAVEEAAEETAAVEEPVVASSRAAARRGAKGAKGAAGAPGASGGSLADRAKAARDKVLAGDHVPSRRALLVRAGAGAGALAVLVAAGLMVGIEGDGGSAAADSGGEPGFSVAHSRVWAAQPAAAVQPGADDTLVGSWLLPDAVVRADASGVHAYDRTAGKPTWSVEPPAAGAVPCGLSAGVNQAGLGAALFRPQADPKSPCTLVAAVDTKTGKTVWTKAVSDAKGAYGARVGVTEDKVIAVGDDRAIAWESADGKDVWQYTGQGKFCTLSGGVTGKTVMVASSCADSTPADQAVALNTADGKVSWWRGLNNQPKTVTVLSAEPAVVLTTGAKPEDDRVFAWGANGDPAAEIPVTADGGRLAVAHGTFSATPEVFFQDRTLVAALAPTGGGPVSVAGYDLDTGKQRWKAATGAKGAGRVVGLDGGAVLLAVDERRDQPAHLSRFPMAGGQESTGGNFPAGTGSLLVSGRVLIGGGQVVVVPEHSGNFGTAAGYQAKG